MNSNASAISTPSGERYRTASENFARGDMTCAARVPFRLAGERRKIFVDIAWMELRAGGTFFPLEGGRPPRPRRASRSALVLGGWHRRAGCPAGAGGTPALR